MMKLRLQKLWMLPAYYLAASWFNTQITALAEPLYMAQNEAGEVYADPLRTTLLGVTILALTVLIGQQWLCKNMTPREIGVSMGILSSVYFILNVAQLLNPALMGLTLLSDLQSLNGWVFGFSMLLTNHYILSLLLSSLTPLLFLLFDGKTPIKKGRGKKEPVVK